MTAISYTFALDAPLPRPQLAQAVLFSLLLHVFIVVLLHERSWHDPSADLPADPLRIQLRQPPPADSPQPAPATVMPETGSLPDTGTEVPTSASRERAKAATESPAQSPSTPADDAAGTDTTAPTLSVQQLRQQAIDTATQRSQKRIGQPDLGSLPANWTRDALPGKATAAPEYLEPLSYTGPTGSQQWREPNGQIRSETVLSDGTVVCSRSHTLMPNSSFQTTVMMSSVCGKKTGSGRDNPNALSRFHPGNVDSVRAAANAESGPAEPDAKEPDAKEPDAKEPDAEEPDAEEPDAEEPDAEDR